MGSKRFDQDHYLFVIVFYSVLSLGCFWQIFNICKLFFNYPTNIFIDTTFEPKSKPLPALSFCANIWNNSGQNTTEALENHSAKYKNQMFYSVILYGEAGNKTDLKDMYLEKAIERVSFEYYCITVNSLLTVSKSNRTELKWTEQLRFEIKVFAQYGWWLYLHNSYDEPPSYTWNAIEMRKDRQYRITWKLGAFRLLESPYPTNCRHYRSSSEYSGLNYLSRKDCIRECKLNASLELCRSVYKGVDIHRGDPSARFSIKGNTCFEKIDFDSICDKKCRHFDCVVDYYEPLTLHDAEYELYKPVKSPMIRLDLVIPTKPETAYYHEPRIELVEFICYLASTVSMWFGFSMYSLYYLFTLCRNRIVSKAKSMVKLSKLEPESFFAKKAIPNKKFPGTHRMGWYSKGNQNLRI